MPKNQFTSTYQPSNKGIPRPTRKLKATLKKILALKIPIEHPATKEKINMPAEYGIMLRLVWNALQGEHAAIKEVFDRIDGKVPQEIQGEGFGGETKIIIVRADGRSKGETENISRRLSVQPEEVSSS